MLAAACLSIILALFPVFQAGSKNRIPAGTSSTSLSDSSIYAAKAEEVKTSAAMVSTRLHEKLDLGSMGLSIEALQYAYTGYMELVNKGAVKNSDILTVCDFSQSSRKKRMYIIDLKKEKVLVNTYVAHGKNSGIDYATKFSNIPESLQSSLGFYVTKGTYFGKHGLSLKLDGQERGFNDKAEERAVVIHGADYIGSHRLGAPYMGRSFGCPAIPEELKEKVINLIKNGTTLFIYHPSKSYLHGSRLLND